MKFNRQSLIRRMATAEARTRLATRKVKRAVASAHELGASLQPKSGGIHYLGYTGAGNLGDDACLESARLLFAPEKVIDWGLIRTAARRLIPGYRGVSGDLMLGGGTLIGRYGWLESLESERSRLGGNIFGIGVGVEDPFEQEWSLGSVGELERWIPILSEMSALSVRGRRSAEVLEQFGIHARVTGDLALGLSAPVTVVEDRRLSLCLGSPPEGMWGGTPEELLNAVRGVARRLIREGWAIRLYVLWKDLDSNLTRRFARQVAGGDSIDVVVPRNPTEFMVDVGSCTVLVGMRLHSVILASVVGVPTVSLAYRPKCEEFCQSIGRSTWSLRTGNVVESTLHDMIKTCAVERDQQSASLRKAIDRWRAETFSYRDHVLAKFGKS